MARSIARIALTFALVGLTVPALAADPSHPQASSGTPAEKPALKVKAPAKPAKKPAPHKDAGGSKSVAIPAEPAKVPVPTPKPAPIVPPALPAPSGDAKPSESKPAAHFASLRADKVYLRSGPSADYPIQWVYVRRGMPVEVLASFDIWRKIRDFDGTEGWVHQQMLTGKRSVLVSGVTRDLRREHTADSEIVAQLEAGVVAAISHCDPAWCEVKAGGYKGWLKRAELWGLEPDEVIE